MFVAPSSYGSVVDLSSSAPGTTQLGTSQTSLTRTAKEFESILFGQWLGGAESSFGTVPGGEDDSDAGEEQMKGFAVQQLAKSFSDSGGVGIAKLVLKALDHAAQKTGGMPEAQEGKSR